MHRTGPLVLFAVALLAGPGQPPAFADIAGTWAGVLQVGATIHWPDQGSASFPAVLLVTGSDQQNRDEEIFSHKPFLVLADALTRRGIAVNAWAGRRG